MDKETEQFFTVVKEDIDKLSERVEHGFEKQDERFEKQDELLNQIALTTSTTLEIVKSNDVRIKEMEASIREHERRIFRLEKKPA